MIALAILLAYAVIAWRTMVYETRVMLEQDDATPLLVGITMGFIWPLFWAFTLLSRAVKAAATAPEPGDDRTGSHGPH